MLEGLCNLHAVTGKEEYRKTANRFDHQRIFAPLAEGRDELKGVHANTNIPKITGVARRYEPAGALATSPSQTISGARSPASACTRTAAQVATSSGAPIRANSQPSSP